MLKRYVVSGLIAAGASGATALAGAPEPAQKVDLTMMAGRWYEVARFPNKMQKDCQGATSEWTRAGETFQVVQTCRKGALNGPVAQWRAKARVTDPATNAKFRMSFFGGVLNQEYWVLDWDPRHNWVILGTPGGNHVWLMSRGPQLASEARREALNRIKQLGYDVGRLQFTPQPRN